MYFHNVVGTGSYTTSTTNMYNKDRFHVPFPFLFPVPVAGDASGVGKDAPGRDQRQRFGQIQNGRFV